MKMAGDGKIASKGASRQELENRVVELESNGVQLLVGTVVDFAGVIRGKGVPVRRLPSFHSSGMGASPSWNVFCADNAIAFTSSIGVTGDLRLKLDTDEVRQIDKGLAWGPASFHDQDGTPSPYCARGRLAAIVADASEKGLHPLMGTELEFTLTTREGGRIPKTSWAAYGMKSVISHREFLVDLTATLEKAGVWPEQIHAEYGEDQFEVSLAPAGPVQMADLCTLTKILIGMVADRHGLGVSFSPLPWTGGVGNGAHLHLSLAREGAPLFAGGDGPYGMTREGGSAIGGILQGLNDFMGVYAGSVVSGQRLLPGQWAGASACWGLENREAALRFLAATAGNPHGANVELKIVDPSANIYLAAAALLGSALHGIDGTLPLPAEASSSDGVDPSSLVLCTDPQIILKTLENSELAARTLGPEIVEGVVAVRRHEAVQFGNKSPEEITCAFRFAWSS